MASIKVTNLYGNNRGKSSNFVYTTSSNGSSWSAWAWAAEERNNTFEGQSWTSYPLKTRLKFGGNGYIATRNNLNDRYEGSTFTQERGFITDIEVSVNIEKYTHITQESFGTAYWSDDSLAGYSNVSVYILDKDPRTLNASQIEANALGVCRLGLRRIKYMSDTPDYGNSPYGVLVGFRAYGNEYPVSSGYCFQTYASYSSARFNKQLTQVFTFNDLHIPTRSDFYIVAKLNGNSNLIDIFDPTVTYEQANLGLSVSPSTVMAGGSVRLDFTNRMDDTLTVDFNCGGHNLYHGSLAEDYTIVPCPRSWFADTGNTSSNAISIDVEASDGHTSVHKPLTLKCYEFGSNIPGSRMVGDHFTAQINGITENDVLTATFKSGDTVLHTQQLDGDSIDVICPVSWFLDAGVPVSSPLVVDVFFTDQDGKTVSTSFILTVPRLGIGANKSSVTTGEGNASDISFSFVNRTLYGHNNDTLSFRILYGDKVIDEGSVDADTVTKTAVKEWFTLAGDRTHQSITLTAEAADDLGRETQTTFTLVAGEDMKPRITMTDVSIVQDERAIAAFPQTYIANYSKAKVEAEIETPSNAGVSNVVMQYDDHTNDVRTETMALNAGTGLYENVTGRTLRQNTSFTVTATDERGFTTSKTFELTEVYPYSRPAITISGLGRCLEDGTYGANGEFFRFQIDVAYTDTLPGNRLMRITAEVVDGDLHELENGESYVFPTGCGTERFTVVFKARDRLDEDTVCQETIVGSVGIIAAYNRLVKKYKPFNDSLEVIPLEMVGYPELMRAYFNTVDMELFLRSGLMPNLETASTDAEREAAKLSSSALSPVAVSNLAACSTETAESAVLAMAKCLVRNSYKVSIEDGAYNSATHRWTGTFRVTNYGDEEDSAMSQSVTVTINDNMEDFIRQKIEKQLSKESDDATDIVEVFRLDNSAFEEELNKYSLNSLVSFREACQACMDLMIQNGVGTGSGNLSYNSSIYRNLYTPYTQKQALIESEIAEREEEIQIVSGIYDERGNLVRPGVQNLLLEERDKIQAELDFEAYLGDELWKEFSSYRREDNLSNQNYISDGLTNADLFKNAEAFLDAARREIYKSAESQHSIEGDMHNLLTMEEFRPIVDDFRTGNWIRVGVDGKVYKLRLYSYEIDFDTMGFDVTFTDLQRGRDTASDVNDLLSRVKTISASYQSTARQQAVSKQSAASGVEAAQTAEAGSAQTESTQSVFNGRVLSDSGSGYEPTQYKITPVSITATEDGWGSSKTVLGHYAVTNPVSGQRETHYGATAEYLDGSMRLGESGLIYNDDGSVLVDKDGIEITADNTGNVKGLTIRRKNGSGGSNMIFGVDASGTLRVDGVVTSVGGSVTNAAIQNGSGKFSVAPNGKAAAADITITGGSIDLGDGKITANEDGELAADTLGVAGDASVGGYLGVEGDAHIGGALTLDGAVMVGDELTVIGAASFGDGAHVDGNAAVSGAFSVTGDADVGGDLDVEGDAAFAGAVGVGGALKAGSLISHGIEKREALTQDYGWRFLYGFSTASPLFGDIGEGVLDESGEATVTIDPILRQVISTSQYQVWLQCYGEGSCYVSERGGASFVVRGTPGLAFGWELKARQLGCELLRLESVTA